MVMCSCVLKMSMTASTMSDTAIASRSTVPTTPNAMVVLLINCHVAANAATTTTAASANHVILTDSSRVIGSSVVWWCKTHVIQMASAVPTSTAGPIVLIIPPNPPPITGPDREMANAKSANTAVEHTRLSSPASA